jgi:hypothetical protein
MSPVHVIVGTDPRAEAMWADAFSGAIDLYQFDRNVDAFERLTAAQAPIDLVILTPAQDGLFNLTPDQFVARVLEGPLAATSMLANLHIIVVGAELARRHPRAVSTRTLDAAIRLVKFGELDDAPRAIAPAAAPAPTQPADHGRYDAPIGSTFSDNVISRIWAAADRESALQSAPSSAGSVRGGGPAAPADPARLFATAGTRPVPAPDPAARFAPATPVVGGGPVHVLANVLSAELGSAPLPVADQRPATAPAGSLQPSRPYVLPHGGAYVGREMRNNQIPPASSYNAPTAMQSQPQPQPLPQPQAQRPVPPAVASQIRTMVYPQATQAPADPVLAWSSASAKRVPAAMVPVPARPAAPAVHVPVPPMQPPVGVYGGLPAGLITPDAPVSAVQADPFVQRAVQDGGVSFG